LQQNRSLDDRPNGERTARACPHRHHKHPGGQLTMKRALLTAAALLLSTARKRGSDRSPN
jgi:hypothetical protein